VSRTEISETTQAVVDAMVRNGVRRIVAAANGTVLTDKEITGEYANVAANIGAMPRSLRASGLEWTLWRRRTLTDDPATGEVATAVDAKAAGRSLTAVTMRPPCSTPWIDPTGSDTSSASRTPSGLSRA
jgi:hypothetical protein